MNQKHHLYPFFDWKLFSQESKTLDIFQVEITKREDGQERSMLFPSCCPQFKEFRDKQTFFLIQKIGKNIEKDPGYHSRLLYQLEKMIRSYGEEVVAYEFIKLTLQPQDYLKSQKILARKTLSVKEMTK